MDPLLIDGESLTVENVHQVARGRRHVALHPEAIGKMSRSRAVIEAIGAPISQTGIVSGNSNVSGPTGRANLSIPLSGPKGKATLYVEAMKSADLWIFQTMVVKIEKTGERIDLNKLPRQ